MKLGVREGVGVDEEEEVGVIVGVRVGVGVKEGVALGVPERLKEKPNEREGVRLGVTVDDAEGGVPTMTMLSMLSAAEATPVATAVMRQHTVGLLSAAAGMAGDRSPVNHVAAGASETTGPKVVKTPAVPVVEYENWKLVRDVAAARASTPH